LPEQLLINSIYPVEYFQLPGVDQVDYPDNFWWASKQRFASQYLGSDTYAPLGDGGFLTSEVLEIDLGRIREVNYVNLDVLQAPIDIAVEYDAVSAPDRAAQWAPVTRVQGLPFDNQIFFSAASRTAWHNCDLFFAASQGGLVHTRYLRFTFTRRGDKWPTSTSRPFKWPVMAKHLRLGRFVSRSADTAGPLLTQDTPADLAKSVLAQDVNLETREARQKFRVPPTALRGGDIWPNALGFGLLMEVKAPDDDPAADGLVDVPSEVEVSLAWELWDVSDNLAPTRVRAGVYSGVYPVQKWTESPPGSGDLVATTWVDWYLEESNPIPTSPDAIYEFRVRSLDRRAADAVFLSEQMLSSTLLPGTLGFTSGDATVTTTEDLSLVLRDGCWIQTDAAPDSALQVATVTSASEFELTAGFPAADAAAASASRVYPSTVWDGSAYVEDGAENLVMRVWADVADEGRDVLGNSYRYGVRRDKAAYVVDGTRAGWMSDPAPSKDAVESLYFDVRQYDELEAEFGFALLDGLRVAPRTPGVKMNIYYTRENLDGERPTDQDAWDYLLWTPVSQQSFVLRKNMIVQFPSPVRASFVKLEFTDLDPLPWRVPHYPPLPPKLYRRFPTWVEDQFNNARARNVVEDWWLRNSTPVQQAVVQQIGSPIREFEYKEREFFASLALGEVAADRLIGGNLVSPDDRAILDPTTGAKIYLSFSNKYANTLLVSVDQDTILGRAVVARFDPYASAGATEPPTNGIPPAAVPTVSSVNNRISEAYSHLSQVPMRFNRTARHVYRQDVAEFNRKAFFVGVDEVQFFRNQYTVKHDDAVIKDILHDDELLEFNTWEREETSAIADGQTLYVTYQIGTGTDYYADEAVTLNANLPARLQGKGSPISNVLIYASPSKRGVQYWQNEDWALSRGVDENGVETHSIARSDYHERLGVPEQPIFYADADIVVGRAKIPAEPHDDGFGVVGYTPPVGVALVTAVEVYQTPTLDAAEVIGVALPDTAGEGPWVPAYGEMDDSVVLGRPSEYGDGTYGE